MIRFLEAQRLRRQLHRAASTSQPRGSLLLNHKLFISSGHDEYWSGDAAHERRGGARRGRQPRVLQRQRGVLEDPLGAEHRRHRHAGPHARLLQGHALHAQQDPVAWTGTWRDPRFTPPPVNVTPENALTGQSFLVNSGTSEIKVPTPYGKLRMWRNTAVAT